MINIKIFKQSKNMYSKARENNNILNPGGQPGANDGFGEIAYKPERGGYNAYGQHKQS